MKSSRSPPRIFDRVPGDDDPHPLTVRCAIYTRQSVVRDGDPAIASCKLQRAKCIEFIRSMAWRGWFVAGEHFDDEGQSGATTDRPGLAKLLKRIEDGEVHPCCLEMPSGADRSTGAPCSTSSGSLATS